MLDKAGIVSYQQVDRKKHLAELRLQLESAQAMFSQRSRAVKYTIRGLYLEALIYYHKYVLKPLVDVYRIIHTPFQADCFLVHASRDFPSEFVTILENLYTVRTVQDISAGILAAEEWFEKANFEAVSMLTIDE